MPHSALNKAADEICDFAIKNGNGKDSVERITISEWDFMAQYNNGESSKSMKFKDCGYLITGEDDNEKETKLLWIAKACARKLGTAEFKADTIVHSYENGNTIYSSKENYDGSVTVTSRADYNLYCTFAVIRKHKEVKKQEPKLKSL